MIGRLNHVAIAVPDLEAAAARYRDTLGASVGPPQDQPDHGVTVVFIELPNTKIELLSPLGEGSPIAGFLAKNPAGGIHHVCYEVDGHRRRPRPPEGRGRARPGRRRAQDRRPRQAGPVPAPQGLPRHPGRAGAGLMAITSAIVLFAVIWFLVLFVVLPLRAADPRRGGPRGAGHARLLARGTEHAAQVRGDDDRRAGPLGRPLRRDPQRRDQASGISTGSTGWSRPAQPMVEVGEGRRTQHRHRQVDDRHRQRRRHQHPGDPDPQRRGGGASPARPRAQAGAWRSGRSTRARAGSRSTPRRRRAQTAAARDRRRAPAGCRRRSRRRTSARPPSDWASVSRGAGGNCG